MLALRGLRGLHGPPTLPRALAASPFSTLDAGQAATPVTLLGGFLGAGNILEQYPKLVSESVEELKEHKWPTDATGGVLELTEPFHYQPGDCTLHHGWCVHGGPDNTTPDPRWSYLFSYSPADTRYWPEQGESTATSTATNPGTRRLRSGDEINPLIRPKL